MLAAPDWSAVTLAGAFVVGTVAGVIATIRIVRLAIRVLEDTRKKEGEGDD